MHNLRQKGVRAMVVITLLVLGIALTAAWKSTQSKSASTTAQESSAQAVDNSKYIKTQDSETNKENKEATGTVITSGESQFGTMLFNTSQQAIYIWEVEESTNAECYADCADLWPPVLTDGSPRASGNVKSELLGTTTRTDGSVQVTYNGHPLYYYAHEGPGEVECHNIITHGGLWWVIHPDGNRTD